MAAFVQRTFGSHRLSSTRRKSTECRGWQQGALAGRTGSPRSSHPPWIGFAWYGRKLRPERLEAERAVTERASESGAPTPKRR
jgi:hypothetical protein